MIGHLLQEVSLKAQIHSALQQGSFEAGTLTADDVAAIKRLQVGTCTHAVASQPRNSYWKGLLTVTHHASWACLALCECHIWLIMMQWCTHISPVPCLSTAIFLTILCFTGLVCAGCQCCKQHYMVMAPSEKFICALVHGLSSSPSWHPTEVLRSQPCRKLKLGLCYTGCVNSLSSHAASC